MGTLTIDGDLVVLALVEPDAVVADIGPPERATVQAQLRLCRHRQHANLRAGGVGNEGELVLGQLRELADRDVDLEDARRIAGNSVGHDDMAVFWHEPVAVLVFGRVVDLVRPIETGADRVGDAQTILVERGEAGFEGLRWRDILDFEGPAALFRIVATVLLAEVVSVDRELLNRRGDDTKRKQVDDLLLTRFEIEAVFTAPILVDSVDLQPPLNGIAGVAVVVAREDN